MHPSVPLIFRMIVLATSTIALGLAASVHHVSDKYKFPQNPSTTMAIVVDIVAMPYILYITWDEYTGKPLGLRSPKTKIRLVLLDVFFIIFESANLSLAFAALTDRNTGNGLNSHICRRVKALCGILMVALIAWSMTFAVSIFRYVLAEECLVANVANSSADWLSVWVVGKNQTRECCQLHFCDRLEQSLHDIVLHWKASDTNQQGAMVGNMGAFGDFGDLYLKFQTGRLQLAPRRTRNLMVNICQSRSKERHMLSKIFFQALPHTLIQHPPLTL